MSIARHSGALVAPSLLFLSALVLPATVSAQEAPRTVQPGAPGEANRILTPEELARAEHPSHTAADISFMQGMIVHHGQALVMTNLAKSRAGSRDIQLLAQRIELSQDDEIRLMERWLRDRGEPMTPEADPHAMHQAAGHAAAAEHAAHQAAAAPATGHEGRAAAGASRAVPMHGMLTPEELDRLAATSGREFDRLFLEYMIRHHEGAVTMVNELFASPGAGQEGEIFQFASHVEADQNIEIRRMQGMLATMR
jgi:uncharacterized protein (DUF305 family)